MNAGGDTNVQFMAVGKSNLNLNPVRINHSLPDGKDPVCSRMIAKMAPILPSSVNSLK